jgi:hypothetical protein
MYTGDMEFQFQVERDDDVEIIPVETYPRPDPVPEDEPIPGEGGGSQGKSVVSEGLPQTYSGSRVLASRNEVAKWFSNHGSHPSNTIAGLWNQIPAEHRHKYDLVPGREKYLGGYWVLLEPRLELKPQYRDQAYDSDDGGEDEWSPSESQENLARVH